MKNLLIVVDFQNDFVNGSLGFKGAEALEEPISKKIIDYKNNNYDVIYTMDTHTEKYLDTNEGKFLPVIHCIKGTHGWNLYGKVKELLNGCKCFEKPCFGCADLIPYLKDKCYDTVELCGLVSNICVISNAVIVKAALPECKVLVDACCTSCADANKNKNALDIMEELQICITNK